MVEYLPLKGPRYRARLGPYHSVPPLLCATFLVADFTVRRMTVAMRRCTHQRREQCRSAKISHNVRRYNRERWDALPAGSARHAWASAMSAIGQTSRGNSRYYNVSSSSREQGVRGQRSG